MAFGDFGDLFWGPCGDYLAAPVAAFGADIDNVVGGFYHIEIVFDDDYRVPLVDQFMQDFEKLADIFEMQAGRGFIQDVKGSPC